jgi:hypothetical protein
VNLQRLYYSLGIQDDDILVKFKAGSEPDLDTADVIGDNILVKVIKAKENISTGGILVAKTTVQKGLRHPVSAR